jgi:urease accessory protein
LSVQYAVSDAIRTFAANRARGRIALAVAANGGITHRARVREEGSLRVRCPTSSGGELEAVILNTAGGIAGGDRLDLDITVAPGARLVATSAAVEKIYRALDVTAQVGVKLRVGAGGSLAWLPQETILFDRAQLVRDIDVELHQDARLILAEAIVFGRSGMGEVVSEGRLIDRWRLRRDDRLIHAEAVRLEGSIAAQLNRWAVAKGAIAFATVLVAPGDDGVAASLRAASENFSSEVGISAWNGLAAARLCAPSGAALHRDLVSLLTAARGAPLPRLWLN